MFFKIAAAAADFPSADQAKSEPLFMFFCHVCSRYVNDTISGSSGVTPRMRGETSSGNGRTCYKYSRYGWFFASELFSENVLMLKPGTPRKNTGRSTIQSSNI